MKIKNKCEKKEKREYRSICKIISTAERNNVLSRRADEERPILPGG